VLVVLIVGLTGFILTSNPETTTTITPTPPITVTISDDEGGVVLPTPSAEPTATGTATAVPPTDTPTVTATNTPNPTATSVVIIVTSPPDVLEVTARPTWTPLPSPTASVSPSPSPSATISPTATATLTATVTPTPTATDIVRNKYPPQVQVIEPSSYDQYAANDLITFSGTAEDVEDGDLSDKLIWTSDHNGEIGHGASFEIYADQLTPGFHTITASVSDSGDLSGESIVIITIVDNTPPKITVDEPSDGEVYYDNLVVFDGTAMDDEDGDVTESLVWTSDIDGDVAWGGQSAVSLSWGKHTITVTATDKMGASTPHTFTITLLAPLG
jgi:hypothetical protein